MSSRACQSCGGTNVEVDSSRGIAVCTDCGVVLEENCIVSEVQFEENAYGGASAIGQFLSSESQGGTGFMNAYRGGNGKQSREITMRRAKERISLMGQQLKYFDYWAHLYFRCNPFILFKTASTLIALMWLATFTTWPLSAGWQMAEKPSILLLLASILPAEWREQHVM